LLNERILAAYKYGPESYMEILLSSEDFTDLLNRFNTLAYFVKSDLKIIDEIQQNKVVVNAQHQAVQEKTKQYQSEYQKMVGVSQQVSQEETKVSQKVVLTKHELAKIQNDRAKLEKALEEYEETSKEIEAEIKKSELANSGEVLGTGKMLWPVKGRLSSGFGWRVHPVLKTKKYHNGQDIAVPSGTPVYAADSGKVVVSGWTGGYGNYIAIDHGHGISTGYGHNSRLLVSVGEKVVKGQKISLSGNTGLSTGPHLHFEVRLKGVPVNPLPYLP
jgi:murein DD-endopeptidase MepM/ murein hydrolase activator NlpD